MTEQAGGTAFTGTAATIEPPTDPTGILSMTFLEIPVDIQGRRFVLKEMSGKKSQRYLRMKGECIMQMVKAIQAMIEPTKKHMAVGRVRDMLDDYTRGAKKARGKKPSVEDLYDRMCAALHPVRLEGDMPFVEGLLKAGNIAFKQRDDIFCWILFGIAPDPPDGVKARKEWEAEKAEAVEWMDENLGDSMRERLVNMQDELNGIPRQLGNAGPLTLTALAG